MNITQKILASLILIVLVIVTIMPTVQAVSDNVLQNGTEEDILYQNNNNITTSENANNNTTNNEVSELNNANNNQQSSSDFDVLLAGVLNDGEGEDDNTIDISEVPSIILSKPSQAGIYISENSREYLVQLVNSLTNKNYKIDTNGFLIEDLENLKDENQFNENYVLYTNKIDELINSQKTIIISINSTYCQLNESTNEILPIIVENDEFALLFKDSESEDNLNDIVILNSDKYNIENTDNSFTFLMNKLLEVYYSEDEEFNNFVNNVPNAEITDNNNEENESNENIINNEEIENTDNIIDTNNFNSVLAGILFGINNATIETIQNIDTVKPNNTGIWVEENSREIFLNFLNTHGIYTYSVNSEGYLLCDKIMKNNPNLDFVDKTEVDFEIENILEQDIKIYVSISSSYLTMEDNMINNVNLLDTEYVKTFDNESSDSRIVLLNSMYFNNATGFNLELSDRFVKKILDYGQSINLFSDTSKTGNMVSAQTVYAGPSSSDYATVGSVDPNEQVYILGQTVGWYHIQYHAGSAGKQKAGFVPKSTLYNLNVSDSSINEETMTGGQRYAKQNLAIQSCDDTSISTTLGTVYAGEGLTLLYDYGYSGGNGSYRIAFIEISTSSGTKRGYVYNDQLDNAEYATSVARVISTSPSYSGPDTTYVKLGGAYTNEYVSILAKEGDWVFTEYNTTSGRKRGFMSYSNLSNCNHPGMYNDFPTNQGLNSATQQLTVYGGPNSNNANIGLIYNQEVVSFFGVERGYAYIEYSTLNGAKRGYVLDSALQWTNPPSLPNVPTYANFSKGSYGTSGLGQDLNYYKIGNGPNVAFAVFEQHGWEDAWAFDGVELVNIASRVMNNLSSSGINSNWTLYIIPYANPDGITNGYTNNGPGRCAVSSKVDMNRCWPANFSPYYTSRNYTGDNALGAQEAVALKNFITNNIGNSQKIVLDIHGWLNQTYGDYAVAQYFNNQFGFGHSSSWGSGYLETWAKSIGAQAALIELPMPSSSSDILNRDFSGKITSGIINLLGGSPSLEGGTTVYETVKVTSSGNLNVRVGPGTSYSLLTSLSSGSIVTRIKTNVATNNGYSWDKIRLSDGREGYVATNYLQLYVASQLDGSYNGQTSTYSSIKNIADIPMLSSEYVKMIGSERETETHEYASNLTNHVISSSALQSIKDITVECCASLVYIGSSLKDSAENMLYYLTKGYSGKVYGSEYSYTESPYKAGHVRREFIGLNLIGDSDQAYNHMMTEVGKAVNVAEKFTANNSNNVHFVSENEYEVVLADENNDTLNWETALGAYRTSVDSTVTKNGTNYTMHLKYHVEDYYDWREDDENFSILALAYRAYDQGLLDTAFVTASSPLWQMNIIGMARNYTNYDVLNLEVTWSAGQNVNSGATVRFE